MGWTLVTGGARGIGADIAKTLAKEGFKIVLHYHTSESQANEVVEECRALGAEAELIQGNFSNSEDVEKFLVEYQNRFKVTENLVLNVGYFKVEGPLEAPLKLYKEMMHTNYFAPIALVQALCPSIVTHQGKIISIGTSGMNHSKTDTYATSYKISKEALYSYMRAIAIELAGKGVTVNTVSPGQLENSVDAPRNIPMRRLGKISEVSRVVSFLLNKESGYITGQNIEVDGALGL